MPEPRPARPTLLGLPFDGGSSFLRGAAAAPAAIRAALASDHTNWWTEDGRDLRADGGLADAGDVPRAAPGEDAASVHARIAAAVGALAATGARPLLLGGDHAVSYPALRGLRPHAPSLTVLHVDAHPDLYPDYAGDRLSHACPFARVLEDGLADRVVQVGIRASTGVQRAQARRLGVEVVDMAAWARGARPSLDGAVYLSFDLDALDPAFAPGVSHREPGGLTTREALGLVQGCGGRLVGADVVELNPSRDVQDLTACAAAKLVKEVAARLLRDAGD
ncbi:agmatinase [Roseisolibacter sp. H3M3-2]|uniref:agmatinase n=1 Tax=Roseisolibacter sp. H3M3-2 TaxID=3031323 RepID=UPI0023DB1F39|nr:agmatinase [Roseisolibacter sp. H3M3-2]MDF1506017.1 agmatinase [Roseisolibacter sp. H3M3-2]